MNQVENPFACGACLKTFSDSKLLLKHVQAKHPLEIKTDENDIIISDQPNTENDHLQDDTKDFEDVPIKEETIDTIKTENDEISNLPLGIKFEEFNEKTFCFY